MEIQFPLPQKKKNPRSSSSNNNRFTSLFPVPTLAADNEKSLFCPYFIGILQGNHVLIQHSGDAKYLYKMGCFGKGTLSRSLPEFEKKQKFIDVPKDGKVQCLKVMDSKKYICHFKWMEATNDDPDIEKDNNTEKVHEEMDENSVDQNLTIDPLDDINPDSFVVNAKEDRDFIDPLQGLPALKKDPFPINEHLLLTFEEAFFLSYAIGCLLVEDASGKKLNLCELWKTFCEKRKSFLATYIAYHYYRSCGWVPKPGLKFGTDLILYKEGNSFYHATYSVNVRMVESSFLNDDPNYFIRKPEWITLSGLDRMNEHAAKQLLFCYVIKPTSVLLEELFSPKCISSFSIQEIMVSRWVSSQDRERKNSIFEEFP